MICTQSTTCDTSEELIPFAALKASVNKAAYGYTEKHVGPHERVGNKGGTLANRLRAAVWERRNSIKLSEDRLF
jgi:hypothetical protein